MFLALCLGKARIKNSSGYLIKFPKLGLYLRSREMLRGEASLRVSKYETVALN